MTKFSEAPAFVNERLIYLTKTGSVAYGCSTPSSDLDLYGVCVPPISYLSPYGLSVDTPILGFGTKPQNFEQYLAQNIQIDGVQCDVTIFSVVKFFQLCMDNNPNMLGCLFTPDDCVEYCHSVFRVVREKRQLFLSKQAIPKFIGYARSQEHKMKIKKVEPGHKRYDIIQRLGYDSKFLSHSVRLVLEAEQILTEGDLDLRRNGQLLLKIRNGEIGLEEAKKIFEETIAKAEAAVTTSKLPNKPDEKAIKKLLLDCVAIDQS